MKTLLKISWKNVWRNRSRSLVIIVTIVLGLLGGVFSASMRLAMEQQQFEDTIENQVSHIQLHHPQFVANPEVRYYIAEGMSISGQISEMPEVKSVSPRTVTDGMASSAYNNTGVRIKGIDPLAEANTTKLDGLIYDGTFFTEQGVIPSVIIGRELAKKINADLGSRIVLTFQDIHGEVVSGSFRIEGIYTITSKAFEERNVFVNASSINELTGNQQAVTEIAVLLHENDQYRPVSEVLAGMYPELLVRHWADIDPGLYYRLEFLNQNLIIMMVIIIMAVSFGLLNTILMSILERVRELGVLLAIGMKKMMVFTMIVIETTLISITGGLAGLILSWIMMRILGNTGVRVPGGEGLEQFGYASVLYPNLDNSFYFQIGIVVVVFAILASIYPAWKAIRLEPAVAVRQE